MHKDHQSAVFGGLREHLWGWCRADAVVLVILGTVLAGLSACSVPALWPGTSVPAAPVVSASAPAFADIGVLLTPEAIAPWNIDIASDGRGLPAGSGDVRAGATVFAQKCAVCHDAHGEGGLGDPLVGGRGTLASRKPLKTIGSYWPYATTLFDYIRRAMPYNAPQSLTADEVYAVSAWLLNQNGIVPADTRLDAQTLPAVRMPNREGFYPDPRGPGRL